jgi:dethiobiotin synthetase
MRIVLVGTGTDVGKTHVACALLAAAHARGVGCRGYKPVATGVGVGARCDDAAWHAKAACADYVHPTYEFVPPVSPHLAAREAGVTIDVATIAQRAAELDGPALDVHVIETAGGLFSPLADRVTNADLVRALAPARVVLVAPDRIGVLHDVNATVRAARAEGITLEVVLSAPAVPDASTGTNAAELERLGIAHVLATFPRALWDTPASLAAAHAVLSAAP